jgi:hypothetical protein
MGRRQSLPLRAAAEMERSFDGDQEKEDPAGYRNCLRFDAEQRHELSSGKKKSQHQHERDEQLAHDDAGPTLSGHLVKDSHKIRDISQRIHGEQQNAD